MKLLRFFCLNGLFALVLQGCASTKKLDMDAKKPSNEAVLQQIIAENPFLDSMTRKNELGIQIMYTQINRDKKGIPRFTDHSFQLQPDRYFYPASTVKLPVAILALQKLRELNIPGLDMNTTMLTGVSDHKQTPVYNDPSAKDGRPTIAHYIKKILLVSDNDAFNRLYEFLGQEYINTQLQKMGYDDVQIIHRLSISLTDEQNRNTNPIKFVDTAGAVIYEQPAKRSTLVYQQDEHPEKFLLGKGYMKGDVLIHEPFDFRSKNRLRLQSLHDIVRSIVFPNAVPAPQRFKLMPEDYTFLQQYMSMRPGESVSPVYVVKEFYDNYVKMLYYGSQATAPDTNIRIFNKTGTAYGFLIDAAYVVDYTHRVEYFLSAVMYCNSDGIFNDDRYDYTTIGYPFLKELGRAVHRYELKREKKYLPDLSPVHFDYGQK